ncbi:alpha/beta hydrolase [Lactobacillus alvi]|uniref:Alpha/beta hydrolase n=1 Tax=Limosilactobacillus alvi TaxID=990412 RepID=A0ABS2ER35_9LACO|nr:alpha/beta hydrolase [Limosilactobacillus alvi]MBM6754850.1 alpha/beta hydrolase [Limosilactobacillus alvi]
MKQAYLIHGTSTRDDDWFPWLEDAAKPAIKLDRLWLPDPFSPDPQAWDQAVDDQIPVEDGITIVAHSLGCITALRFVARHQIQDVRLLLVGAFDRPLPLYPSLDGFTNPRPDYADLRTKVSKATVITAKNDPIAPYRQAITIASELEAKLICQEHGGHYLTSDGFRKFPLALKELVSLQE